MRQHPFLLSCLLFLPFSHTLFATTAGDEDTQQYWLCVFKDGDSYQACAVDPRSYLNKDTDTIDYSRVPGKVMSEKKVADQNPDNFYYCFFIQSMLIILRQNAIIHLAKQGKKGKFQFLFQEKNGWLQTYTKTQLGRSIDRLFSKKDPIYLFFYYCYNAKKNAMERGKISEKTKISIFQALENVKTTWEEKTESGSTKSSPLSSPPLSPVGSLRSTDSSDESKIPKIPKLLDLDTSIRFQEDLSKELNDSSSSSETDSTILEQNHPFIPFQGTDTGEKTSQPQADKSFFPITGSTMQDAGIFLLIASLLLGGSAYLLLRAEKKKKGDLSYEEYLASLSEIEEGEE